MFSLLPYIALVFTIMHVYFFSLPVLLILMILNLVQQWSALNLFLNPFPVLCLSTAFPISLVPQKYFLFAWKTSCFNWNFSCFLITMGQADAKERFWTCYILLWTGLQKMLHHQCMFFSRERVNKGTCWSDWLVLYVCVCLFCFIFVSGLIL